MHSSSPSNSTPDAQAPPRPQFAPIAAFGRGDKSGFLFQRSAANPREWQRRWFILLRDELVHCLSNTSHADPRFVRLNHAAVKPVSPRELGGTKHCFEIDTPHEVLQFRAKTEDEAKNWVAAIKRNVELAAENEALHMAELMIEDGQRAVSARDEAIVSAALE